MKPVAKRTRQELLNRVGLELGREISAQTVFFHESVAHKLGLNATDTRSLEAEGPNLARANLEKPPA
jgi:hypothetical protein